MNKLSLRIVTGASALVSAAAFTFAAAPAFAVTHGLSITALTTDNSVESAALGNSSEIGDDRGGIALTTSGVLNQGDSHIKLFSFDLATSTDSNLTQEDGDALFTDVGTAKSYFFNYSVAAPVDGNEDPNADWVTTLTGFTNVTADGNVGTTVVDLSEDVDLQMYDFGGEGWIDENYALVNGNGIVGIWDMGTGDLIVIDIATGVVTHVAANTSDEIFAETGDIYPITDAGETDETFMQWGILEFDGTDYSYVGPAYSDIDGDLVMARLPITAAPVADVTQFIESLDGSDMWRIVPDCANGRWYSHDESNDEKMYAADITCELGAADAAELPNTGADFSTGLGLAAALTAAGGLLVLRRRATR